MHTKCVLQVSIETKEILPVIREIGEKGQDDGTSGKLNGPVGIASCGNAIQIADHPTDNQGLIGIYHSLEGLTLSGPGGGGSEARMAKLTAANQKSLTL